MKVRFDRGVSSREPGFAAMAEHMPGALLQYVLGPGGEHRIGWMSTGCHELWEVAPQADHGAGVNDRTGAPSVTGAGLIGLHLGADLLAQDVDGDHLAIALEVPIGPAVAAWRAFVMRADLMDRPFDVIADQRAIGAGLCKGSTKAAALVGGEDGEGDGGEIRAVHDQVSLKV